LSLELQNSVEARSEPLLRAASYHSRIVRYFGISPEVGTLTSKPLFCVTGGVEGCDDRLSCHGLDSRPSILSLGLQSSPEPQP
jgi:hypothetical protein